MKRFFIITTIAFITLNANSQNKTATIKIVEDAYISDAVNTTVFENTNYSHTPHLVAGPWTHSGAFKIHRMLLGVNVSSIPAGSIINNATLYLYGDPLSTTGSSTESTTNEGWIQRITENWDIDSVTWNNQPATMVTDSFVLPSDTILGQRFIYDNNEADITEIVQYFVDNPSQNYGVKISLNNETNYYCRKWYASSNHGDSTLHPKVIVNYKDFTSIDSKLDEKITLLVDNSGVLITSNDDGLPQINVFDSYGRLITLINPSTNSHYYRLPNKGVYLLKFSFEDYSYTKKIVSY